MVEGLTFDPYSSRFHLAGHNSRRSSFGMSEVGLDWTFELDWMSSVAEIGWVHTVFRTRPDQTVGLRIRCADWVIL